MLAICQRDDEEKFATGLTGSEQQSVVVKYNLRHVYITVCESDRTNIHIIVYHLPKIVFNLLWGFIAFIIFDDDILSFLLFFFYPSSSFRMFACKIYIKRVILSVNQQVRIEYM